MVFSLRVTLSGIKGFYRVYQVNGATTLYTLHKQLRSDLEFPQDQLIMFKGLDVTGGVVGRWGLFDLGAGTVDQMPLEKAVKAGVDTFVYFYDVTNKKSVNIVVEGEADAKVNPDFPVLAESKGPNPIEFENGYVAFEDLPERQRHLPGEEDDEDMDDEDLEAEEGDEEDEDGKEIFDEGEE
ncbi:MAG: hypothetical protein J6M23_01700 [Bacteroidales bacterium]|nr:hypothetical protein [Bacteroidales bacterium]